MTKKGFYIFTINLIFVIKIFDKKLKKIYNSEQIRFSATE